MQLREAVGWSNVAEDLEEAEEKWEGEMVEILAAAITVLAFELLVWFYAVDSTDGFDSSEWERRRRWRQGEFDR